MERPTAPPATLSKFPGSNVRVQGRTSLLNLQLSIVSFAMAFFALTAALQSQLTQPGVETF
jgi:hypothetical protein